MGELLDCGKPVVLVNMSGSSVDLRAAQERAGALLQAWYPGSEGGRAVAQVLFGEASPSGKLPVTFYNSTEDLPDFNDYSMENRTYRYYQGTPLYPFGYGLTYGRCEAVKAEWEKRPSKDGESALLRVTVSNSGNHTEEVLQVYVKAGDTEWAPRNPALGAFQRVRLEKGETRDVTVELPMRAFTTVDKDGVRVLRGSHFEVYAGFSQPDRRSVELTGTEPVRLETTI